MQFTDDKWAVIQEIARREGVKADALRKWATRGVPGKWHAKLIDASGRKLKVKDFLPSSHQHGDAA